jgi:hypothetical protein
MSAKILKLIPKLVDKKGGIKLADVVTYLKGRDDADELGDISFASVKKLVIDLFTENKIDLVEYKCPGEDQKPKMFLIPIGTTVTYEDEAPAYVLPEPVMEIKNFLPSALFEGYLIIPSGEGGAAHTLDPYEAFGIWTKMAGESLKPRIFGAVPINLEMKVLLDTVADLPAIPTLEHTTASFPVEEERTIETKQAAAPQDSSASSMTLAQAQELVASLTPTPAGSAVRADTTSAVGT